MTNYSALLTALDQGALVITGNNRLARTLQTEYQQHRMAAGDTVWSAGNILPLPQWLQQQWLKTFGGNLLGWQSEQAGFRLLNTDEEAEIWRQIVANSAQGQRLLHCDAIAKYAQQAAAMLVEQCETESGLQDGYTLNDDTVEWLQWLDAFNQRCQQQGWLSMTRLPQAITGMIQQGLLPLPPQVLTIGFEEFNPLQQGLWQAIAAQGTQVQHMVPEQRSADSVTRFAAASPNDELQQAAQWAKRQLASAALDGTPSNIGVVIMNLDERRAEVEAVFRKVLAPHICSSAEQPYPFNISLGLPLSDWPLSRQLLLWLQFAISGLDSNALGQLLRNPWQKGGLREADARATLDAYLRKAGKTEWRIGHLMGLLQELKKKEAAAWLAQLESLEALLPAVRDLATNAPSRESSRDKPSAWCAWLNTLISTIAWPMGEAGDGVTLSGDEHQLLGAWDDCLDSFAGMDEVLGDLTAREFLRHLQNMAQGNLFQPRSASAPIQIMGLLEASGARFDALWVAGLSDATWPESARPNPLLPIQWQRQKAVAHASVSRELEYAKQVTAALKSAANEVIFSHSAQDGEEEFRCSPLLADLPEISFGNLSRAPDAIENAGQKALLETVVEGETDWVPLKNYQAGKPNNRYQVKGGTRIIENQAKCAFRAFAEHRLYAEPLEEPRFGIDQRERGSQIHRILETIWQQLKQQRALLELDEPALQTLVEEHVQKALDESQSGGKAPSEFELRLADVEKAVLTRLVLEWLALDKQRSNFTAVETEKRIQTNIGVLDITVVADRIDTLPDGKKVIIDYKNSKYVDYRTWLEERPEQPQMPIYAVTLGAQEQTVAAVLYGNVVLGESKYQGVTDDPELAPNVKALADKQEQHGFADVGALYDHWETELTRLAGDYAAGVAVVNPKQHSCQYCGLSGLCRVAAVQEADDE